MRTPIQRAADRLRAVTHDTETERERDLRRITINERADLELLLDELHRLHQAASEQRAEIDAIKASAFHSDKSDRTPRHPGKRQ